MTRATYNAIGIGNLGTNFAEFVNNNIHNNGRLCNCGYGIYAGGGNHLIERNNIHHNYGYGLHLYSEDGNVHDNIVRYNLIHDNDLGVPLGARIYGAIIAAGQNHLIYNNVIWNDPGGGIQIDWKSPSGTKIYNNTIYNTGTSAQGSGYGISIGAGSTATNIVVKNNMVYQSGGGILIGAGTGNVVSNNLTSNAQFVRFGKRKFQFNCFKCCH